MSVNQNDSLQLVGSKFSSSVLSKRLENILQKNAALTKQANERKAAEAASQVVVVYDDAPRFDFRSIFIGFLWLVVLVCIFMYVDSTLPALRKFELPENWKFRSRFNPETTFEPEFEPASEPVMPDVLASETSLVTVGFRGVGGAVAACVGYALYTVASSNVVVYVASGSSP